MNGLDAFLGAGAAQGPTPLAPRPVSQSPLDAFMSGGPQATPQAAPALPAPGIGDALVNPFFWQSVGGNVLDMGRAFAHHAMNIAHGGAQLVENIAGGLAQRIAPDSPVANAIADTAMRDEEALRQREAAYQAAVPDNPATYLGAAAGEVAPFLLSGGLQQILSKTGEAVTAPINQLAAKVPSIAPALRLAGRSLGGALQGAEVALPAPVLSQDQSYLTQKGQQVGLSALVGGAVPPLVSAVKGTWGGLNALLTPFTNPESIAQAGAERIVGDQAPQIAAKAASPEIFVPGSMPTTAQAAPTPGLVQAEKIVSNRPDIKPLFVQRELENNAARIAAVQSVAGDPGALENAINARNRIAKNLYGWAFDHQEPVTPWMKGQVTQLVKRPAIQQAMQQARILAANEGTAFTDETSIKGLHYAKMALDDQIDSALAQGNGNQARVLIGTRDKLLTFMEKLSPTYAQARAEFAAASRPINTMEVANELLDKLNTNAYDASGMPKINYSGYRNALAKALSNSDYPIDPQAQAVLEGVQKDLQRATISGSVRVPGSDTAFNLASPSWLARHVYGQDYTGPTRPLRIAGMVAGSALAPGHTLTGLALGGTAGYKIAEKVGNMAADKVNAAMADALLNPEKFAALLRAADAGDAVSQSALERIISARGVPALAYAAARQQNPPGGLLSTQP